MEKQPTEKPLGRRGSISKDPFEWWNPCQLSNDDMNMMILVGGFEKPPQLEKCDDIVNSWQFIFPSCSLGAENSSQNTWEENHHQPDDFFLKPTQVARCDQWSRHFWGERPCHSTPGCGDDESPRWWWAVQIPAIWDAEKLILLKGRCIFQHGNSNKSWNEDLRFS